MDGREEMHLTSKMSSSSESQRCPEYAIKDLADPREKRVD